MSREAQVRFREGVRVKSPRATRHVICCELQLFLSVMTGGVCRLLTLDRVFGEAHPLAVCF